MCNNVSPSIPHEHPGTIPPLLNHDLNGRGLTSSSGRPTDKLPAEVPAKTHILRMYLRTYVHTHILPVCTRSAETPALAHSLPILSGANRQAGALGFSVITAGAAGDWAHTVHQSTD